MPDPSDTPGNALGPLPSPELPETPARAPNDASRARLGGIVGRLAFLNAAISLVAVITGPLQARALGADGRGELAAILVPFVLAPLLLSVALGTYATRESARGKTPVNELVGSVGAPLLVMTLIGMAAGFPVADLLAGGNETVRTYLIVGFLLLPIGMASGLLNGLMAGLERWDLVIFQRSVPIAISFVGIVVMFVLDEMTVARVAIITMAGSTFSILPSLIVVAHAGRPVFRRATARASVAFGIRSWVGSIAFLANLQLDQLLMIVLVNDKELGIYVVAVTLARLSSFLPTALTPPLMTRVSQGENALVPRALRVVLLVVASFNIAVAALAQLALPAIFGSEFDPAVDQARILLAAGIPITGSAVLATALAAINAPGKVSIGEGTALFITVPGLLLLVPSLAGLGAAIVSLVAYSVSFTYQLYALRQRIGGSLGSFLLPRAADVRWLVAMVNRKRPTA